MQTSIPAATPAYDFDDDGRLTAAQCRKCGLISVPPRPFHCNEATEVTTLAPVGDVESWTVIRVAPEQFPVPYSMAYVRLESGPRVLARVVMMEDGLELKGRRVTVEPDPGASGHGLMARLNSSVSEEKQ